MYESVIDINNTSYLYNDVVPTHIRHITVGVHARIIGVVMRAIVNILPGFFRRQTIGPTDRVVVRQTVIPCPLYVQGHQIPTGKL